MSDRLHPMRQAFVRRALGLLFAGLTLTLAFAPPTSGAFLVDSAKRRAVTQDVLSSQRDPRGKSEKLAALRAYERFVMEDLADASPLRADAMHMLADLYAEIEIANSERAAGPVSRAKSILVYERLLARYPDRAANDAVLYQVGRALADSGRLDDADIRFQRILREFPSSRYVPEAAFRLARRAFDRRKFSSAADLLTRALHGQDPVLVEAARFHLGWTNLNLQAYRKAADEFSSILDVAAKRLPGPGSLSFADLPERDAAFYTETINALLIAFDYLGGPEAMTAYFRQTARRPYEETLYRTLASLYLRQDRTADAVAAYEAFLTSSPMTPAAPTIQAAIAELYTEAKWQRQLLAARERLVSQYGPGTAWARAHPSAWSKVAQPLVKEALYELALYDHVQAQKRSQAAAWKTALARHDQFLHTFPNEVESARITWLRGEALFELGRFSEAADAYRRSAYDFPLHAQSRDAGYAMLMTQNRLVPPSGPVDPDVAVSYADGTTAFVAAFPDDERNPDLLMSAADTLLRAGRPAAAADMADRLVTKFAGSTWSPNAYRLIAQGLYDQGRFRDAEAAFRQALVGASGEQRDVLTTLAASSLFQSGTGSLSQGRQPEALTDFVRVADEYSTTRLAPAALREIAQLHEAGGRKADAASIWRRLAAQYPNSDESVAAARWLAEDAESSGHLSEAITWYDRLSPRIPATERTDLNWHIAVLAERDRNWTRARRAFGELAAQTDLPAASAIEAAFRAAAAAQSAKDAAALDQAALDRYRTWRSERDDGPLSPADSLAAASLLARGNRHAEAAAAIRLTVPLDKALKQRQTEMDAAVDAYAEAAATRVASAVTEAAFKIGSVMEEFLSALLASERPKTLTDDQLVEYNFLIEEQAAPWEERAVTSFEANVRQIREHNLWDSWISKSFERLASLRPARYRRAEQGELIRSQLEGVP